MLGRFGFPFRINSFTAVLTADIILHMITILDAYWIFVQKRFNDL